jgi:hypothetical protein
MSVSMIGLDTAKSTFQIHAVDEAGQPVIRRKLQRKELIAFFRKLGSCTVVMEACGAAHHWGRRLSGLGHEVKLVAPEATKLFVKKARKMMPPTRPPFAQRPLVPTQGSYPSRVRHSKASWRYIRFARCWSSSKPCWRTLFVVCSPSLA